MCYVIATLNAANLSARASFPGTILPLPVYTHRMENVLSDAEAIANTRQGDLSAYTVLVEHHQTVAFRAAYLILSDAAAAEDVTQEAFVRAYREIGRFRQGEAFRPWLLRIVTNLALNELRSRGRRTGLLERFSSLMTRELTLSPEEEVAAGYESAAVVSAMQRLNQNDRLVLQLRYFLGLDEKEMCVTLNKPAGTVKSRLHRAGKRLREIIERDYPELRDADD
jgi:RNA polymerase sigma factor (sigma-70 family)